MGSLAEVIDFNNANAQEAIKFGHTILIASQALDVADPSSSDSVAYRSNLVNGKSANRAAIDNALADNDLEAIMTPAGTLTGIGARAGYPQLTVPAGYAATTRRPVNISFNGTKYTEAKLIGFAYAYEQATHARRPVSVIDPSLYRCAKTDPPSPYASRGGCSPGKELLDVVGTPPDLGFSLETATASELESRLEDGTLTSVALTKAYLARIARTNTDGPSIDAVRSVNPQALDAAAASDARRTAGQSRGPLEGLPVLLNDDVDVDGLPTTLGSVALQDSFPAGNSMLTARLESAGAIVLGKTNTTELSGWTSTSMPGGYSSLGGQVLDPSDADITPSGSSSGAAAATAAGLAALTFGTGGSSVTGSLLSIVAPSQANGVVGLKPTVGLVSRAGILTITQTQETAGPIGRTVRDVATGLQAVAGTDPADPATAGQPPLPDYLATLSPTALAGKRVAVVSSTDANYNAAVAAVQAAGATTVTKTIPAPSPNPADIVGRELKRDLNAYLGALPAGDRVHSLQEIVDYNLANAEEALKYGQGTLTTSNAVDLSDPATNAAYVSDRDAGKAATRAVIDTVLDNATPADPTDDFDAILVPANTTLTGIADRAGYPQLTVPAGYDLDATKTSNPVNVSFVGTAFSEASLLADAYAYEQLTSLRRAPLMGRTLDPARLGDHLDRLYRAAWALSGSREDAEDLVQETYARLLARPRLLRNEDDLGYLLRALRNTFLNQKRTESRRLRPGPLPDELDLVADSHALQPQAALEAAELYAAVAALPGDFRDVLVAVDITGLSYKEAARALRIREGTVMSRLYRARQQVVRRIEGGSA